VSVDENEAIERYFVAWARMDPQRSVELLKELEPEFIPPESSATVAAIDGRPNARRVQFRFAA
jgi:hypothetical protein